MGDFKIYKVKARPDDACANCGYPFDSGDPVTEANNEVYCHEGCASSHINSGRRGVSR